MASLSGVSNWQEFSDLGVLAAGFRLYTYLPSTTTHTNVFTDAAAAVPHTYTSDGAGGQYIALNSRGEVAGNIYFPSGGVDLNLKTAAGSAVWTKRAVGQNDSLDDSSSVALGDALVATKRVATGAVAMTVHSWIEAQSYNVKEFGAVGDGVTDDTAAIQAAINASRNVFMPAGTYKVASALTVPLGRKGLTIRGEYLLTKLEAVFAGAILSFPSGLTTQYIHIDGLTFQASGTGDGAATGIAGSAGLAYVMLTDITNCQFSGSLRYGFTGNFLQGKFDRCGFGSDRTPTSGKTFKPIKMYATDSFQTTIRIIDCEFNSGNDDYVIDLQWGTDVTIRGGAIESNTTTTGVIGVKDFNLVRIEEVWAETNGAVPFVKTLDGTHAVETKVMFKGCFLQGNGSGANDVIIDTTSCTGKLWGITDSYIATYTKVSLDSGTYDIQSRIFRRGGNKSVTASSNFLEGQGTLGTVTNDSAAAGIVGESVSASQLTPTNFPATTTYGDGTSISLGVGDWDVSLQADAALNGATMTGTALFGISSTTGNSNAGLTGGDNLVITNVPGASANGNACIANYRVSLAATTTYYAKVRADFSAGNPQYRVRLSARRMR